MGDGEVERLLRDLVQMTKVQVYPVAKNMLRDEFFDEDTPRERRIGVYANLDGSSQSAVAEEVGVSQSTVSSWSQEWKRKGLVDEEGEAVFDIYDFFPDLEG